MRAAFEVCDGPGTLVSLAVHAGHDLRPAIASLMAIDNNTRRREEDPFTDLLVGDAGTRMIVRRSRFEVDINRPRDRAVYLEPADAWDLEVWTERPPDAEVQASLAIYDDFYAALAERLDRLAAAGRFVVLDVHSYNHRRQGPSGPAAPEPENPEVNVGTGALDQRRWGPVVERFIDDLRAERVAGHHLDVRENIRFSGGYVARWVAGRYPDTGCVLAIEFKKLFMDEWTGEPEPAHIAELAQALAVAVQPTVGILAGEPG
ncbi:MAG: N-formylglutamate amidohydrolase [Ilumatobacteraceae bacterium]